MVHGIVVLRTKIAMEMDKFSELSDLISSMKYSSTERVSTNLDELVELANEQAKELKRVENILAKLQTDIKCAKDKLSLVEKERTNARKELTKLKEDDQALSKKLNKLKAEERDAKHKLMQIHNISSLNEKERELMKQQEMELNAYKAVTGARINPNVPANVIEVLITNSRNNFAKAAHLERTAPRKKKEETLWNLIKEAGTVSWDQLEDNKENQ